MKRLFLVLCLAVLSACAQLGLQAPETFNERLAVGVSSVTQVRLTAANLLNQKTISKEDAENVMKQTDMASDALRIARSVSVTDPAAADAKLRATVAALTALQTYLASKQ